MNMRSIRTLRGVSAAAIATWTAAVSHTLGGGDAPSPLLLMVVAALAAPFAVALAGRRPGIARLAISVGLSQILFHVAFAWTAHLPGRVTGHVHGRLSPGPGGRAASFFPDAEMLGAHVLAGVVTILVFAYGERLLRALGRGLARLVALRVDVALPISPRYGRAVAARPVASRRLSLTSDFSRRGPPAFVVAA